MATAGPPLKWFAVALVMAAAGVVLALVSATGGGGVFVPALAGWLLAGPLAIGALAVYTRVDTRRRSESIYSAPRWAADVVLGGAGRVSGGHRIGRVADRSVGGQAVDVCVTSESAADQADWACWRSSSPSR